MAAEKTDWAEWHREYDDPTSRLSRRVAVVQQYFRDAIDARTSPIRVVSMCAGEGRDVIGVLRDHPRRADIVARLVEIDPRIAAVARESAADAGLNRVEVVTADAADTNSYAGAVPADIILACGVFGNITDDDIRRTVEHFACWSSPGATVIWTRGQERDRDAAGAIRGWFADAGFDEVAFSAPDDLRFRVGAHRLIAEPRPFEPDVTLFRFFR